MAVHQCERFYNDPKLSHERTMQRIVCYLLDSKEKELNCKVNYEKGIELCVDADFSGSYNYEDSHDSEKVRIRFE